MTVPTFMFLGLREKRNHIGCSWQRSYFIEDDIGHFNSSRTNRKTVSHREPSQQTKEHLSTSFIFSPAVTWADNSPPSHR